MMVSYRKLKKPTFSQVVEVRSDTGVSQTLTLTVALDGAKVSVILSGNRIFSRTVMPLNEALRLNSIDALNFALPLESSQSREVDPEASIIEAARMIHEMHKDEQISHEQFAEHMEMIAHFQGADDIDGLITYLHLEDLVDVASSCKIMFANPEEQNIWIALWPQVFRIIHRLCR